MSGPRIAIVCREIAAPDGGDPSGGYALRLAGILAAEGFAPIVCGLRLAEDFDALAGLERALHGIGASLACLFVPQASDARDSLTILDWLQRMKPSLAVFVGCEDLAYWPCLARKTRTALLATPISILSCSPMALTHGPGGLCIGPETLLQMELQRQALAMADQAIALNRLAADAIAPRDIVRVACPPVALLEHPVTAVRARSTEARRRLVLCGDETASGANLAELSPRLEALVRAWPATFDRTVLFVGSCGPDASDGPVPSRLRALGLTASWLTTWDYLDELRDGGGRRDTALFLDHGPGGFDALVALAAAGALAGVSAASPYAGLFAEAEALLFPASEAGFVTAAQRSRPSDAQLRPALKRAIETENSRIVEALRSCASSTPAAPFELAHTPKVSVCISHFNRPLLLDQAIRSLEAQTYPDVEIIVVDDASPGAEARAYLDRLEQRLEARGGKLIRNREELWQQESRNVAARAATGKYVLIMDDDNCARPDEILTMATVAENLGAKVVRCLQNNFSGDDYPEQDKRADLVDFFPVGGPLSLGTMWNVFGDVNVMFERELFLALGGYRKTEGLGCEDFEIGIRYTLQGAPSITIPRVLYDYRLSAINMAKRMPNKRLYDSHARLAALFENEVPAPLAPVFRLLNERFHRTWQREGQAYWSRPRPLRTAVLARPTDNQFTEVEALLFLAELLIDEGDPDNALVLTRQLRSAFPDEPRVAALETRAEALT